METIEKIGYLLSLFIPTLLFFLLGLWLAYWLWYRRAGLGAAYETNARLGLDLGKARDREHKLSLRALDLVGKKDTYWGGLVAERDSSLEALNKNVAKFQGEATSYKADLDAKDKDLGKLNLQFNKLGEDKDAEISGLVSKLGGFEGDISKRDKELADLRAKLKAATDAEGKLKGDLSGKDKELDDLRAKLKAATDAEGKLKADLSAKDKEIGDWSLKFKSAGDNEGKLKNDLAAKDKELGDWRLKFKSAGDNEGKLKNDLAAKDKELGDWRLKFKSAGDNEGKLKNDLAAKDKELNDWRLKFKAAGDAEAKLKADLAAKDKELNSWNLKFKAAGDNEGKLKNDLAAKDKELGDWRLKFKNAGDAEAKLKKDLAAKDKELGDWRLKFKSAGDAEAKLKKDLAAKDKELGDWRLKFKNAGDAEAKLKAQLDARNAASTKLEAQLKDLDTKLKGRDREFAALQKGLADRDKDLNKLRSSYDGDRKRWDVKVNGLTKDVGARDGSIKDLQAQLKAAAAKDKEIKRLQAALATTEKRTTALDKDLSGYQTRYKTLEKTASDRDKALTGAKRELAGREKDVTVITKDRDHWRSKANDNSKADALARDLAAAKKALADEKANAKKLSVKVDQFAGESVAKDKKLGFVYKKRPSSIDDLKKISGVAGVLEKKLHKFGVYRYKQIVLWEQEQIDEFSERLNFPDRVERDMWVHQATDLHYDKYKEHLTPRTYIYRKPETRPRVVEAPKPKAKKKAAKPKAFAGESVKTDAKLGVVFTKRPKKVDDLKRIKGVANVLEKKLHNFGVYRFKQIALWNKTQIAEFSERLSFRDRVERDKWTTQAAKFHLEEYGEKV